MRKPFKVYAIKKNLWVFVGDGETGKSFLACAVYNAQFTDIGSFEEFKKTKVLKDRNNIFIFNSEILAEKCIKEMETKCLN